MVSVILFIASKVFGALLLIVKIIIKLIVALGKGLISLTKAIINKFNKPKEAK